MKSLHEQIKIKELELNDLRNQLREFNELTVEQQLAIELHQLMCHGNHTDGCGWYYEFENRKHKWNIGAHKDYLERATKLYKCTSLSVDSLVRIIKLATNR